MLMTYMSWQSRGGAVKYADLSAIGQELQVFLREDAVCRATPRLTCYAVMPDQRIRRKAQEEVGVEGCAGGCRARSREALALLSATIVDLEKGAASAALRLLVRAGGLQQHHESTS